MFHASIRVVLDLLSQFLLPTFLFSGLRIKLLIILIIILWLRTGLNMVSKGIDSR